jgi:hypothetical protein
MYFGEPMKRPCCVRSSMPPAHVLHEAEIEDLDDVVLVTAIDEEDVAGLEIAVDDAELVGFSRASDRSAARRGDARLAHRPSIRGARGGGSCPR